jgi:hypothetical protein
MMRTTVIAGLATATLVVGAALFPNGVSARGIGAGGFAPPGWTPGTPHPEWGESCSWVRVKSYNHQRPYWHWVRRCQSGQW